MSWISFYLVKRLQHWFQGLDVSFKCRGYTFSTAWWKKDLCAQCRIHRKVPLFSFGDLIHIAQPPTQINKTNLKPLLSLLSSCLSFFLILCVFFLVLSVGSRIGQTNIRASRTRLPRRRRGKWTQDTPQKTAQVSGAAWSEDRDKRRSNVGKASNIKHCASPKARLVLQAP